MSRAAYLNTAALPGHTHDLHKMTVTEDGGFMMNSQELETAVRLKLNIVVLIMNDSSYGLIKWKQMDQYGETYFTDFANPGFRQGSQAEINKRIFT